MATRIQYDTLKLFSRSSDAETWLFRNSLYPKAILFIANVIRRRHPPLIPREPSLKAAAVERETCKNQIMDDPSQFWCGLTILGIPQVRNCYTSPRPRPFPVHRCPFLIPESFYARTERSRQRIHGSPKATQFSTALSGRSSSRN
ncbi:hypothetical protein RF11_04419 [Thelohanellus kitauei]|uniref:Uncharacterized protein n=1 Tax=Thelohanellus kitauei TaxID=669202 RepID=A0A0C2M982_THEKT|nr:hypothetical protein RF11_04419 [Thelohanellus kitauei]